MNWLVDWHFSATSSELQQLLNLLRHQLHKSTMSQSAMASRPARSCNSWVDVWKLGNDTFVFCAWNGQEVLFNFPNNPGTQTD